MTAAKTIFKKILDGEIPADIVYQDDLCLAFKDIRPAAPVHVLVIPREEIPSWNEIQPKHQLLMGHLALVIQKLASQLGLQEGYRVVCNCGELGGQTVPHLHFHLLGQRALGWPPG